MAAAEGVVPSMTGNLPGAAAASLPPAGQWWLTWRRLPSRKLAVTGGVVVILLCLVAASAEFLAPFSAERVSGLAYAPPQRLRILERGAGGVRFGLHVFGYASHTGAASPDGSYRVDRTQRIDVRLLVKGEPYRLWGLFPLQRHLIGPADPAAPMHLLGADRLGRDVLSRMLHGTRVSITVGLVAVAVSLVLGVLLGGIAGYSGGAADALIQRFMEILRSLPAIPLWMGLAAAIPGSWPPAPASFMIALILSVIGWTWLAQTVRRRFRSLRTEDFVVAARLDGCSELQVILTHLAPSCAGHVIATLVRAVPHMIVAETALSFLGIGLRAPMASWGVLLGEAREVGVLAAAPWLLWPGVPVCVAALAFQLLGDGIRDAADHYR